MRRFLLAICMSMALVMVVAPAYAMELWEPHLPGVGEGLAAGALPPAGFYFIDDFYFATDFKLYGALNAQRIYEPGQANAQIKLPSYVDTPVLLWSTGLKFLCADYAMGIAQPFDWTNLRIGTSNLSSNLNATTVGGIVDTGTQWGTFNTILIPFALSWKLPCDLYLKGALAIGVDDATTSVKDSQLALGNHSGNPFGGGAKLLDRSGVGGTPQNAYAWAGDGEWFFTPNIGISWLHAGWNLSADFFYTFSLKDNTADYQSGDEFQADYTLSYTCGKWTFGVGATQANQVQSDKFVGSDLVYRSQPNTKETTYRVGPLLGYNFGPCSLMVYYNWSVEAENCAGGNFLNARLVIPLGNPCPLGK